MNEVRGEGGDAAGPTTVAVSSSVGGGAGGDATAASSSTGTHVPGAPCDPACPDDQFCMQGLTFSGCSANGQCVNVPGFCSSGSDDIPEIPACGCDGLIYASVCAAFEAGVGTGAICDPPPGMFACGDVFCASGKEACQTDHVFFSATCPALPPECVAAGAVDCTCFPPGTTCDGCTMDAQGNFFLACDSND